MRKLGLAIATTRWRARVHSLWVIRRVYLTTLTPFAYVPRFVTILLSVQNGRRRRVRWMRRSGSSGSRCRGDAWKRDRRALTPDERCWHVGTAEKMLIGHS